MNSRRSERFHRNARQISRLVRADPPGHDRPNIAMQLITARMTMVLKHAKSSAWLFKNQFWDPQVY